MSTEFIQVMMVDGRLILTFLWQGQICVSVHLFLKNIEKSLKRI